MALHQISEEEMAAWHKKRAEYVARMSEGFPEEFALVFQQDVSSSVSVASSLNCAFDYVARCKSVTELISHIGFTKTPRNPNSSTPSLLPDFIKFTYKIANTEENDSWDFSLVGCLAVLANFAEDPDCLAVIRDFSGNLTHNRYEHGSLSYTNGCAREAWIVVLTRFFDRALSSLSCYGIDEAGRENMTRALAHQLWEKDGKPEGKEQEHWNSAAIKVESLISLIDLGILDTVFLTMQDEAFETTQRYYKKNGHF